MFKIEFDPRKREAALERHKVDFNDAPLVFAGKTIDIPDLRRAYGEPRTITIGIFAAGWLSSSGRRGPKRGALSQ